MSSIDPRFWLDLAQWITTLGIGFYVWLANHNRATRKHIKEVDNKHAETIRQLGDRLIEVEGMIRHLPSTREVAEIGSAQGRVEGMVKAVDEKVDGVASLVRSMQSQLAMLLENELAEGRASKKVRK